VKKGLFVILFFYLLLVFHTSFLANFKLSSSVPNLAIIFFIILILTGKNNLAVILAFPAGLMMDIFTSRFLGFWVLILLSFIVITEYGVKKYIKLGPDKSYLR